MYLIFFKRQNITYKIYSNFSQELIVNTYIHIYIYTYIKNISKFNK